MLITPLSFLLEISLDRLPHFWRASRSRSTACGELRIDKARHEPLELAGGLKQSHITDDNRSQIYLGH